MVSRAFTPSASISEKKRKMILEAATKLGYTPNAIARGLISKRSGLIAIAIDNKNNPMYDLLTRELSLYIQQQGYQVVLCSIDQDDLELAVQRAIEYQVDGLIIATSRLTSRALARCETYGICLCLLNRFIDDLPANSISLDNYHAGELAARHLTEQGFRQLAFISGERNTLTSEKRWLGFSESLNRQGYPAPLFVQSQYDFNAGMKTAMELLNQSSLPDALFCANDIIALGVIDGLRSRGLSVPKDLAVMGVDDIPMSSWPAYQLTTIQQPVRHLVELSVNDLLKRIKEEQEITGDYIMVQGSVIKRESTSNASSSSTI